MKCIKSNKSSHLSPIHIQSIQNNKNNIFTQKHKINSDNINVINKEIKYTLSDKVLKIIKKINDIPSQILLERRIHKKFIQSYSKDKDFYNIKIINEIICNENTHIVAEFKDYLIEGDYSEFLLKTYEINESLKYLPKLFEYYDTSSVIFPNYIILPENKYIFKNIQRKQRVIDNQQDLEDKQKKIQKGLIQIKNDSNIVLNTQALDSILEQTDTSGIKDFFGIQECNDKNFSFENIINKISKAEIFNQKIIERKNINFTLKKIKDIEKTKLVMNINNNYKIKGRNYNRYLDGGCSSSISNNAKKMITGVNINSTISNGMKNTKVSTTIEMDSKNCKNNLSSKDNNTISVCSNSNNINNKNNINSIQKPNLVTKLLSYNNKQFIKKVFKEINSNYENKKIKKKNIKTVSSNEKSTSRNKQSNSINQNKKLSSSSSYLSHKHISSFNNKKLFSISKIGKIPHHSKSKSIFSYKNKSKSKSKSKSKEKNENKNKINKIKENSIPFTDRESKNSLNPELMLILNSKIKRLKHFNLNHKISISLSSNKKKYTTSITYTGNSQGKNKKKEKKQIIKKYINKNRNRIINSDSSLFNTNSNYKSPHNKKDKKYISNCFSFSPKKSPEILKTFNYIHSSNTLEVDDKKKNKNKIKNSVFPKNKIKRIQIKGINNLLLNSNTNSRNNSNSERMIFNEVLTNKMNKTNRNNNIYSKTSLEILKKKF